MAVTSKVYDRIWLTDYFHDFPHINFNFKKVNSTFDPENREYQESLAVLVLFPVCICLVLWLIYLIYFIARCCQRPSLHRHKNRGSGCFTGFVILLVLLADCLIGWGFFQNERADGGVDGVQLAVTNINTTIAVAQTDLTNLATIADKISGPLAQTLEAAAGDIPDPSFRKRIVDMIEQMRQQAVTAKRDVEVVDKLSSCQDYLTDAHDSVQEFEYYRWIGTICVFVLYAAVFVCVLVGLVKHWKRLLAITAAFGVLLAAVFWTLVGAYLSLSVGLGDFCVDPTKFFVRELTDSVSAGKLLVYMQCTDTSQPYQEVIVEAQNTLTQATNTLDAIAQYTRPYQLPGFEEMVKLVEANILQAQGNLSGILTNVGTCTLLHNYYISGVNSACHKTLESGALLLVVSGLLALISAAMVFFVSCLWRTYDKKCTTQYINADDTDPFLPRPPPYEPDYGSIARASPAAWSDRGALRAQHPSVNEEQVMFLRHQPPPMREDSPPPAYHSGQFSSQYIEGALSSTYGHPRNQ